MANHTNDDPDALLPSEHDFDPFGDLDAQCAWRNFGGLTLEQAAAKFRERPDIYQEDFMFMGGKAFAFYYPVIDDFLREVPAANANEDDDDRQAWILAKGIEIQWLSSTASHIRHLMSRMLDLSQFVIQNIHRFAFDANEQTRIASAWQELIAKLTARG